LKKTHGAKWEGNTQHASNRHANWEGGGCQEKERSKGQVGKIDNSTTGGGAGEKKRQNTEDCKINKKQKRGPRYWVFRKNARKIGRCNQPCKESGGPVGGDK